MSSAATPGNTLFCETQQFHPLLRWGAFLLAVLVPLGVFVRALIVLFTVGPGNTVSTSSLFGVFVLVSVGLLLFFWQMTTRVVPGAIEVRIRPIHLRPRRIALEDLTHWSAVTYRPILEYGGWGIRWRLDGSAWNVRGNRGVRLQYRNKRRHLLIGSMKADEFAAALDRAAACDRAAIHGPAVV